MSPSRTRDSIARSTRCIGTAILRENAQRALKAALKAHELSFNAVSRQFTLVDKVSGRNGTDRLKTIARMQFDGVTVLLDRQGGAYLAKLAF